ncbi:hypothetical protein E2C01_069400 [Portunus trituberculatus]|uniref:Uncharacterized protein n=1 Tax=Portunus trituberculatus TaxID=210409 RepID=A0A5B7HZ98_PORTR|nr:hypothetical protein [Portunus trituberculatus]
MEPRLGRSLVEGVTLRNSTGRDVERPLVTWAACGSEGGGAAPHNVNTKTSSNTKSVIKQRVSHLCCSATEAKLKGTLRATPGGGSEGDH